MRSCLVQIWHLFATNSVPPQGHFFVHMVLMQSLTSFVYEVNFLGKNKQSDVAENTALVTRYLQQGCFFVL